MKPRYAGPLFRWFATLGGIGCVLWAGLDPRFRAPDDALLDGSALVISLGGALVVLAALWENGRQRFAGWVALLVAGQAAALRLIMAGLSTRYQHLSPPANWLDQSPAATLILAVQGLLVVAGLARHRGAVVSWLANRFRWWQLLALGILVVLSSATLSRDLRSYLIELLGASVVQTISLGNLALALRALPARTLDHWRAGLDRLLGSPANGVAEPGGVDRFAMIAAGGVTAVTALLNLVVYQRHPHLLDEVIYLYQARSFAAGSLVLPVPPVPAGFDLYLMDFAAGGWYAVTPPGWSAVLAPAMLIGAGWLVNPFLAGLDVLLAYVLLRELYDRRTARLSIGLLCLSPWYGFLGMSFMNHMITLACALAATLGVARARHTGQARWCWLGGFALGFLSMIRQLDAMVMAGVLGLWAIGVGGKRLKLSAIAGLIIGSMLVGGLILPYNRVFTGKASVFPIMSYNDRKYGVNSNAYGFGPDRGMGWPTDPGPGHNPRDATVNSNLNITAINVELFGWSAASLLFVGLFVVAGRIRPSDRLMLGLLAAVFVAYFFNYFAGGPDFGGRYWFLMIVPLVALTARGIDLLEQKLGPEEGNAPPRTGHALIGVLVLSLSALLTFYPWRSIDKYFHYLGMRPDLGRLAQESHFGRSLVLVEGDEVPDYASAFTLNPLDLRAGVPVYARDKSPEIRVELLRAYSDRPVWIVDGPTRTRSNYRVVAGPLTAHEAATRPAEPP